MKIAVDGFGGDYAPEQIAAGCLQAADIARIPILLTGDQNILESLIKDKPGSELIEIVHASEQIGMEEAPIEAVRKKKESSLVVAANLVRQKKAAALISAGNTGACMAASLLNIGRVRGIERPAITCLMPTLNGVCLIVDAGANVDCRPKYLLQFAQMGSIYAEKVLAVAKPRIGLLNIGEEPHKGNDLSQKSYQLLANSELNFIGNVEGRDISHGEVDVVVCDGFVGNTIIKFAEGLGSALFSMLKTEFMKSTPRKIAASVLRPGLKNIAKKMDYTEYGGAPLLGVNGAVIIAHGTSNQKAIYNAIRAAKTAVDNQVVQSIAEIMAGE
ncbi:MAG: phosphate acyltransferase PlsX [Firmicutes bacterium]|nr:phosphate acyltransferase PlsX [Bacillota bacterium]